MFANAPLVTLHPAPEPTAPRDLVCPMVFGGSSLEVIRARLDLVESARLAG